MDILKSVLKKEGFTSFESKSFPMFFKDFEVYKVFVYFEEYDEVGRLSIEILDPEIEIFNRSTYDYPEGEQDEKTMKDWLYSTLFDMAMELTEMWLSLCKENNN